MSEERGELTAAEQRLLGLLLLLREEARRPDPGLTARVMRGVRIQHLARGLVVAAGSLAGAVVDGLALIVGPRKKGA